MYRVLSDLRLLEMAEYLEETLERYEQSLRDMIPEVPVRAALAPIFGSSPAHVALKKFHSDLTESAQRLREPLDTQDVLQVMLECERLAQQFYLGQLDRLADPRLVALFGELANEEGGHVAAIHAALERLKILRRTPKTTPPAFA